MNGAVLIPWPLITEIHPSRLTSFISIFVLYWRYSMAIRKHTHHSRETFSAPIMPALYRNIAYVFVAVTACIVFLALWLSSVRATVWISASKSPTEISSEVTASRNPKENEISARIVQGVFEKVQEFKVNTGSAHSVIGTAMGKVRIFNTYSSSQPLVKTTRLLTKDGRLYRMSESVTVPAGGSVDVEAYADEDGSSFDIPAKTFFSVPGLSESMQKFVHAESLTAFKGGERVVRVLTKEDVAKAEEELKTLVLEEGKKQLRTGINDARLGEATFVLGSTEKNTSPSIGNETDSFLLSLKMSVTGVFYAKTDMDAVVRTILETKIPKDRTLVSDNPSKLSYDIDQIDVLNERARVMVHTEVLTKPTAAEGIVSKDVIAGLSLDEAQSRIEAMDGVEDVDIVIRPSWVRRLPQKSRITVKVK